MSEAMTAEALKHLLAEATPGPWRLGSWGDNVFGTGANDEWIAICRVKRDDLPINESQDHADAKLISLAPDLAARAIAALARIAELEAANIEREAELIYLRKYGKDGALWSANESKDVWRDMARAALAKR